MDNLFKEQRIERFLSDLQKLIYFRPLDFSSIQMIPGKYVNPSEACGHMEEARRWEIHDRWGGENSYVWFHMNLDLPENYRNKKLALLVAVTEKESPEAAMLATFVTNIQQCWDLMNPQFMLFVNEKLCQGLDIHHTEVILQPSDTKEASLVLDFQGYAGMTSHYYAFNLQICFIDERIRNFYYDLRVLQEAVQCLPEDSSNKYIIMNHIDQSLNKLDMRDPYSDCFYQCMQEADHILHDNLYGEDMDEKITITCIGHTHIDMAWLWDLDQTRFKAKRSFSTVLSYMKQYPDFIFMHSSPQLYYFIKEDDPELYSAIKERIKEKRWEPEGAMWVEADCNIPCGESLIRQIIFGKTFIKEEFGIDSTVLWLPDVFGYSAALPQILKKTGIDCFVTSKISWNMLNVVPYDTFLWKGIDGEEILTYFISTPELGAKSNNCGATYNGVLHPETVYGAWTHYKQKDINQNILLCYGYGDGGGGPDIQMMETLLRLEKGIPGFPKVVSGRISPYFHELEEKLEHEKNLPKWTGELYLELHQGTYTSRAEIKKNNRIAERELLIVEWMQSILHILGNPYEADILDHCWKILLLNQFHDILPGSSIKKVYKDSDKQFEKLFADLKSLKDESVEKLKKEIDCREDGYLIFNPTSFDRDDTVVIDNLSENHLSFTDSDENPAPIQRASNGQIFVHIPKVPGHGYTILYPAKAGRPEAEKYPLSMTHMENLFYSIDFDEKGNIFKLYDRTNHRDVLDEGGLGNYLTAYDDRPYRWDTWNIDMDYWKKSWSVDDLISTEIVEHGPLVYAIKQHRRYHDSEISQEIRIYTTNRRIDFITDIDWHESSTLLKAGFKVNINSDTAVYDIQYGSVKRPAHTNTSWEWAKYEVCAHKWADLSEGNYGVSLLNDCKYGYSIHEKEIQLTLLKSGMAPDSTIDRGRHHFTYSLYVHEGDCYHGKTIEEAYKLNYPSLVSQVRKNSGKLGSSASFMYVDAGNVIIEVIKQSIDQQAVVIRLYESCNSRTDTLLHFLFPVKKINECSMLEQSEMPCILTDAHSMPFAIKPFEIKTFKVYFQERF